MYRFILAGLVLGFLSINQAQAEVPDCWSSRRGSIVPRSYLVSLDVQNVSKEELIDFLYALEGEMFRPSQYPTIVSQEEVVVIVRAFEFVRKHSVEAALRSLQERFGNSLRVSCVRSVRPLPAVGTGN